MAEPVPQPLAHVAGRNCKDIRNRIGVTQDDLARHARNVGLRWTASKVGDFEAGRSAPTFATVLAVTFALHQAAEQRGAESAVGAVTLADLLAGDDRVALTDGIAVSADLIADVCRGRPAKLYQGTWHPLMRGVSSRHLDALLSGDAAVLLERSGLTEVRIAQRLNISTKLLASASSRLWNRTFSEERDQRAGVGANRQKRAQVSRALRVELEKALSDGDDR